MKYPLPYADFASHLREIFPHYKVQKISLNAGCTCPNKDGIKGFGGCTYCNNSSFTPQYTLKTEPIIEQLQLGIDFFRRKYKDMKFLAYFQSYTNTYGDVDELIRKYETAIAYPDVVGLIIGTRPDCMPDEILNYLKSLKRDKELYVAVEYGMESTSNTVLERVNRGHTFEESVEAIQRTAEADIPVGGHFIFGLPGEDRDAIVKSAALISSLPLNSIKIHQLQVLRGTKLGADFLKGEVSDLPLFTYEEYLELVADFLCHLRPDMYVDRFVSSSPPHMVIAPQWGMKNYYFTLKLVSYMRENGLFQGQKYCR